MEISQKQKDTEHNAIFQEGIPLLNVDYDAIYTSFHL